MPKMKTNSACKKRFKKTKSGKVKRAKAYKSHHGWSKTQKQCRHLKKCGYICSADSYSISRLLPY